MTALTVGITTALPACKRGLGVNLAASLARNPAREVRACVVDIDPLNLDVTTRLAVRGPCLEDFADGPAPSVSSLGFVYEPPLWVLPSAPGPGWVSPSGQRSGRCPSCARISTS